MRATRIPVCLILLAAAVVTALPAAETPPAAPPANRLRRPVALVPLGGRLYAANRRSGTVSILDPERAAVVGELAVGRQLSDLAQLPGGGALVATDEAAGQLVRLDRAGDSLAVAGRLDVGTSPVGVCVAPDGAYCSVALLWAHQVAIVDPGAAGGTPRVLRTVDLPFAPRKQWIGRGGKVLVAADAFGGNLAVIDPVAGRVRAVRSIPGHNIRGLAAAADGASLLVSHATLEETAPTTRDLVFWGSVMGNFLRTVSLDLLLADSPSASAAVPVERWSLYPLGQSGNGAGDPGDVVVAPDGQVAVALSGVNEVEIHRGDGQEALRLPVGRRPTALALGADGRQVYAANTLDDSVSVIDLASRRVVRTISLGPAPAPAAADRGEALFYDARLSLDGWYSCNSCHADGHTNGLLNDNFSDGSFGTPKHIPSLLGTVDTAPWAWNGAHLSLDEQAKKSITGTMQGKPEEATDANVSDLATFLETLPTPPSVAAARGRLDWAVVERGRRVFRAMNCGRCHTPIAFTSARQYDVGLRDEAGLAWFNPPSLRGVSHRSAFLHDGRAASVRDVITRFRHPDGNAAEELSAGELDDLLAYIESL